ncbi:MAG TPA: 3-deoxy-7-phosphoheptulonate synthase, partial [Marinobacter sp.]|nr:3-deoxy-7-phosphoheptulonate synthase [Marinobacter sp.]
MLAILYPNTALDSDEYRQTMHYLEALPGISIKVQEIQGATQRLTEVYLLGDTKSLDIDEIEALPAVERAIRISDDYRILGRHKDSHRQSCFTYNGVEFSQTNLNVFAGLCAVDVPKHVEMMMQALEDNNEVCTRMGAYKPRT